GDGRGDRPGARRGDAERSDRPRPQRRRVPELVLLPADLPAGARGWIAGGRRRRERRQRIMNGDRPEQLALLAAEPDLEREDQGFSPTPAQRDAIARRDRDVFTEAGAGSGKTGVLVERYCA